MTPPIVDVIAAGAAAFPFISANTDAQKRHECNTTSSNRYYRYSVAHYTLLPCIHAGTVLFDIMSAITFTEVLYVKKVKVAHTRLPSVGFRSWSRFLAVSLKVTWVINPAVGCHYFPPGLQLPSQPLRRLLPISLLGEHRHDWCEQFA